MFLTWPNPRWWMEGETGNLPVCEDPEVNWPGTIDKRPKRDWLFTNCREWRRIIMLLQTIKVL